VAEGAVFAVAILAVLLLEEWITELGALARLALRIAICQLVGMRAIIAGLAGAPQAVLLPVVLPTKRLALLHVRVVTVGQRLTAHLL